MIDYEWSFRFPVPANYIIYRMIHYYLESDGKRRALKDLDFYSKAGLTARELEVYEEMEHNFQNYIKGSHVPLLDMYEDVSPGKADALSFYEQLRIAGAERKLQVFYDRGKDFSENDSEIYPMAKAGLCLKIQIPQGVKRLRLDPGEAMGGLLLRKLVFEDGRPVIFQTNGFDMGDGKYYFGAGDPQFIIDDIQGNTLDIEIEVLKEQEAREEFWRKFSQVSSQKDMEIRHLNEKIRQMENTRVWKLYRSIKKISRG